MKIALQVRPGGILRKKIAQIIFFTGRHGDLQHLCRRRVADVGIFAAGFHQDLLDRIHEFCFRLADPGPPVAVKDVGFCGAGMSIFYEHFLYGILDLLHSGSNTIIARGLQVTEHL